MFSHTAEVYKTISLIEAGVDLGEVMRAVTKTSKLATGFKTFMSRDVAEVEVKGVLALTPADLHQLSAQCRHGGSNSDHNCPNCTVTTTDRTQSDIKVTSYDITRTRQQTDHIVQLCLEWIQANNAKRSERAGPTPKSVIEDIRRQYAVHLKTSCYDGWEFDEHRQGFREAEHLFYYGIFREMLSWFTDNMKAAIKNIFIARIDSFQWPDGMPTLSFDFNPGRGKKKWGTDVSMGMYRQLLSACLFCLDGLVDSNEYNHFGKLWMWHLEILDVHHSVDEIPQLQERGLRIHTEGVRLMPKVYDRPNGHGIVELITRTLPALVYIRLVTSGDFERHHQLTKRTNPSRWFVQNAMKSFNILDTLRLLLHGTRWGPKRQYLLGKGMLNLTVLDSPNIPHPLILNITSVLPTPMVPPITEDLYHYNDGWDVSGYEWGTTSHHARRTTPNINIVSAINHELRRLGETIDEDACSWWYPTLLSKHFEDGSHRVIRVGQTVLCKFPEETRGTVAKIVKLFELRHKRVRTGRKKRKTRLMSKEPDTSENEQKEWRVVFVQVQWYVSLTNSDGKIRTHPVRKTQLMSLNNDIDQNLITCGHIVRQLLPVHACHTELGMSSTKCCLRSYIPSTSQHLKCALISNCILHGRSDCKIYTCADKNKWSRYIQHCMQHNHYEIADEEQGLYFDGSKQLKYVNFNSLQV